MQDGGVEMCIVLKTFLYILLLRIPSPVAFCSRLTSAIPSAHFRKLHDVHIRRLVRLLPASFFLQLTKIKSANEQKPPRA